MKNAPKMQTRRIKSITEFHRLRGLGPPEHPLISLVDYAEIRHTAESVHINWVFDFYSISIKRGINAKIKYGQQQYDFDEGLMFFMSPGQMLRVETDIDEIAGRSGWILLIHPDFIQNTALARHINQYEFFDYAVHEALFLSDKEEQRLNDIAAHIRAEYSAGIDAFSKSIIISQIETLLHYAQRFYQRQFVTREVGNHAVLERLERLLADYFSSAQITEKGLPSVAFVAHALHISPGYLSGLLRMLTGQSTQQHIHDKLIARAQELLSTTNLSVAEIAYQLGFGHSQSFSKMFKSKTALSPLAFRQSFH